MVSDRSHQQLERVTLVHDPADGKHRESFALFDPFASWVAHFLNSSLLGAPLFLEGFQPVAQESRELRPRESAFSLRFGLPFHFNYLFLPSLACRPLPDTHSHDSSGGPSQPLASVQVYLLTMVANYPQLITITDLHLQPSRRHFCVVSCCVACLVSVFFTVHPCAAECNNANRHDTSCSSYKILS